MKDKEFRSVNLAGSEDSRVIKGSIPYNSSSEDLGFFEYLDPHCFDRTLKESKDIVVLYQHNEERPLARTKNGSLRFNNTENALEFEFDVPDTTDGNDLLTMVRSGLISGCSFGFTAIRDRWEEKVGNRIRRVLEARLFHISPVTTPAYSESSLYCRSLSRALDGKELNDMDKEEIKAEICRLQGMLEESPAEEIKAEEPAAEETPAVEEIKEEVIEQIEDSNEEKIVEETEADTDQISMEELKELLDRLAAAEDIIRKCKNC